MKTILIAAVAALTLATSAKADAKFVGCKAVGETARLIMQGRQANVSMSDLMGAIDENGPEWLAKTTRAMIILAYQQPAFSTEKHKSRAIAEFGNEAELACYEEGGE